VKKSANDSKRKQSSKRKAESSTGSSVDSSKAPASIARSEAGGDVDEQVALIDRAQAGDESAAPAVKELVLKNPELARLGGLARLVESSWLRLWAGKDVLAREAMTAELRRLKSSLAGPAPTAIEQVLVDRVAACWVQANYADATEATCGERTISQAEWAAKRQTMAHKRLLSALKTLAEVRRLMTPTVQVNIAEQQVNVAG
jgi:hypothetical protein